MSTSRHNTPFSSQRPPSRDLSAPQLRALRKELLLLRADVERMEFAEAASELRQTVTHFRWLKFVLPGVAALRERKGFGIGTLLKEYPLVSSLISLVLAKPLRATFIRSARPALKWGSLAFAGWEAWRIWQQIKADADAEANAGDTQTEASG
jgi:hypothetical protein